MDNKVGKNMTSLLLDSIPPTVKPHWRLVGSEREVSCHPES